jgi:hypothetical protein
VPVSFGSLPTSVREAVALIAVLCLLVNGWETWGIRRAEERRQREWRRKYEARDDGTSQN